MPIQLPETSSEFQSLLFNNYNRFGADESCALYTLLKKTVPRETELHTLLDKLGKWFLARDKWNQNQYRKMITRTGNRYFNDHKANKRLQLLALVACHEFNKQFIT